VHTDLFQGRDLVEFAIVPLRNADGLVSAASFSTTRQTGFSASEQAVLSRIVPALRNACEILTLRRVELTLLNTYVGATTARRVMAGHIRRGDFETIEAGLMLCDLRGFTELSNRLPGGRVLELLNAYFDLVVPAITQAGGEVIKFMGDAVLAFFHHGSPAASCAAALQGALSARDGLGRFKPPDAELHAGIALHYGEVGYGNIGSGQRLDFTMIGPDVNLVSRIQAVCSATGRSLLMSERFAKLLGPGTAITIGRHKLTGFSEPAELYSVANSLLNGVLHIGHKNCGFHVADMDVENDRGSGS
ncbi:MAG: adenylate/guanylate cyclase domain-containing protein, partial [Mesorhizobium sp.]